MWQRALTLLFADDLARARELLEGYHGEDRARGEAVTNVRFVPLSLERNLRQAAVSPKKVERISLGAITTALLLSFAIGSPIGMFLFPIYLLLLFVYLKGKIASRAQAFEVDYPAFLLSLAASVKTGLDPFTALLQSAELFPSSSLVRKEIEAVGKRLDEGATEEESIRGFGNTIAHPDITLFRTAMILARQEGSSLASCLQRLARVTRTRQSFRRKIRTALAMQKMSAIGIGGCAVGILVFQAISNPSGFFGALNHPLGSKTLFFGGLLMALGLFGIFRLAGRQE